MFETIFNRTESALIDNYVINLTKSLQKKSFRSSLYY